MKPGSVAVLSSTGTSCTSAAGRCASLSARLYTSLTQPEAMDAGEITMATVRLCSIPCSSTSAKRSPGRISSLSSRTRTP
jgi:hypothetical protein